jgi:hypothetical protein
MVSCSIGTQGDTALVPLGAARAEPEPSSSATAKRTMSERIIGPALAHYVVGDGIGT